MYSHSKSSPRPLSPSGKHTPVPCSLAPSFSLVLSSAHSPSYLPPLPPWIAQGTSVDVALIIDVIIHRGFFASKTRIHVYTGLFVRRYSCVPFPPCLQPVCVLCVCVCGGGGEREREKRALLQTLHNGGVQGVARWPRTASRARPSCLKE